MKYKLFFCCYYGKNGLRVTDSQVAIDKTSIRADLQRRGYHIELGDICELDNEVIVYVDIKHVVVVS